MCTLVCVFVSVRIYAFRGVWILLGVSVHLCVLENWSYVYVCVSACVLGRYNSVSVLGGEAWVIFPLGLGKKETLYVMQ